MVRPFSRNLKYVVLALLLLISTFVLYGCGGDSALVVDNTEVNTPTDTIATEPLPDTDPIVPDDSYSGSTGSSGGFAGTPPTNFRYDGQDHWVPGLLGTPPIISPAPTVVPVAQPVQAASPAYPAPQAAPAYSDTSR